MTRRLAAVLLSGIAFAAIPAGPAAAARPLSCDSGRTWVATYQARVFSVTRGEIASTYYGCFGRRAQPRRLVVEEPDSGILVPQIALAGRYVAFDYLRCSREDSCTGGVRVVDLRSGRRVTSPTRAEYFDGVYSIYPAPALVVTEHGSAAWVRRGRNLDAEVVVWPAGQTARTVDRIQVSDGASLAAAGGVVYWTNGGKVGSAPLP